MKLKIRRVAAIAAALSLLGMTFASNAQVACPAVGTAIYSSYTCSSVSSNNAPCTMLVVYKVQSGKAYARKYANAYYRWEYVGNVSFNCG